MTTYILAPRGQKDHAASSDAVECKLLRRITEAPEAFPSLAHELICTAFEFYASTMASQHLTEVSGNILPSRTSVICQDSRQRRRGGLILELFVPLH